jgi:hypothetical protein
MTTNATPPAWAEDFLRLVLRRADFDAVSGDLLEEYRDRIRPARGQARADSWYVTQVIGFAIRNVGVWGALFGAAVVARTALDWFVPTADFSVRSAVSTYVGLGVLLGTGFWSAWRSGFFVSGLLTAVLTAAIGAVISIAGAAGMLAVFHDSRTMSAIQVSGGLSEVFTLPVMMIVPALILGTIGGALGAAANRQRRLDVV